jgi:hypothetical protein
VPTIPASGLWPSAGVANFAQASIAAFCSADIGFSFGFASWAGAGPAHRRAAHTANVAFECFMISP